MAIQVYSLENAKEWDLKVKSFEDYDVFWLSGYAKAFKIHGDGEPLLFCYESADVRGINVVFKRDISKCEKFKGKIEEGQWFDFSGPYGYGGWLIEGDNTSALFEEYENWCKENNIISEFVRFHPLNDNHIPNQNFYNVIQLGATVTIDLTSEDIIWSNITSKNRNVIRKAKKNGVEIFNGRNPKLFEEFKKLYELTMDKDQADDYYYFKDEFYNSILNDLKYNGEIFYATYENKIIAASIMLFSNKKISYFLSGSLREFSNLAPTNLLLYEVALWGANNGYKTFYLGGGKGSQKDSLYKFKKSFNRQDNDKYFYIGKKIYLEDKYNELVKIADSSNSNFFPEYRA